MQESEQITARDLNDKSSTYDNMFSEHTDTFEAFKHVLDHQTQKQNQRCIAPFVSKEQQQKSNEPQHTFGDLNHHVEPPENLQMKPSIILEEPTQMNNDISSNADLKEEMKNIEQTLNNEFRDGIQLNN